MARLGKRGVITGSAPVAGKCPECGGSACLVAVFSVNVATNLSSKNGNVIVNMDLDHERSSGALDCSRCDFRSEAVAL